MSDQRVLVFDLGGVLLPFEQERRVERIATSLAIPRENVRSWMHSGIAQALDRGEADVGDLARSMSALAGCAIGDDSAKALYLSVFEAPNLPLWNAVAALRSRQRVYALSDNPSFVRDLFPRDDAFDGVFWSADLGLLKPDRAVFAAVAKKISAAPGDVVFVDDNAANIAAARAFGWDGVLFTSNDHLLDALRARGVSA